jgi:hypothetical protein
VPSGNKWTRIYELLQGIGQENPAKPWARNIGVRYTKLYTDYCTKNGRERIYTNPATWQRDFAAGFVGKVDMRFREMTTAQRDVIAGKELVLADRSNEVRDAFREMFPSLRYSKDRGGKGKLDFDAMNAGSAAGARADLSGGRGKVDRVTNKALGGR